MPGSTAPLREFGPAWTGGWSKFPLRVGDVVNPLMRPAGVLIPKGAGRGLLQAGFGQVDTQVLKPGMVAEVASKPWTVTPAIMRSSPRRTSARRNVLPFM